jgi:hypothetical protein
MPGDYCSERNGSDVTHQIAISLVNFQLFLTKIVRHVPNNYSFYTSRQLTKSRHTKNPIRTITLGTV